MPHLGSNNGQRWFHTGIADTTSEDSMMTSTENGLLKSLRRFIRPRSRLRQLSNLLTDNKSLWEKGLPDELVFWEDLMVMAKEGGLK